MLNLTEATLVNKFKITNEWRRNRILTAIEAIKTGDDISSDEDEFEDDDGEELAEAPPTQRTLPAANKSRIAQAVRSGDLYRK